MATKTEDEGMGEMEEGSEPHGTGFGERVKGGVKGTVGAIGRAARSAMGQPEAGTDLMFQVLHAEHEEVGILLQKVLATDDEERGRRLWKAICVNLTAHARAEQEVIYSRLEKQRDLAEDVEHSYEEHADIERLLAECDSMGFGTDEFYAMVTQLDQVVRHHVDDEESDILPRASREVSEEERDSLVMQFRERKNEMIPEIMEELGYARAGGARQQRQASGAVRSTNRRASSGADRRRSARRSASSRSSDRSSDELSGKTVGELREIASQKDIRGRSKMDRNELISALRRR